MISSQSIGELAAAAGVQVHTEKSPHGAEWFKFKYRAEAWSPPMLEDEAREYLQDTTRTGLGGAVVPPVVAKQMHKALEQCYTELVTLKARLSEPYRSNVTQAAERAQDAIKAYEASRP